MANEIPLLDFAGGHWENSCFPRQMGVDVTEAWTCTSLSLEACLGVKLRWKRAESRAHPEESLNPGFSLVWVESHRENSPGIESNEILLLGLSHSCVTVFSIHVLTKAVLVVWIIIMGGIFNFILNYSVNIYHLFNYMVSVRFPVQHQGQCPP